MELTAKLFGAPRILADGREIVLPYKKADAVLYYVLVKGSASRTRLAELLWPDVPAETSLKNLRHAVYSIRKSLGRNPFCEQQRSVLSLSPELSVRCDVLEFLNGGDPALYDGLFLEELSIPSADLYESWVREEREYLRSLYLDRLLASAQDALSRGDLKGAERECLRCMQTEPTEENNVMLLMRVYRLQRQFRKAIGLYQTLCRSLSEEFGISPLAETTELYYAILNEWNGSVDDAAENTECLLLGKDAAMRALTELCGGSSSASRCVLVEGEAGVGKTCLLDWALKSCDLTDRIVCRGACFQTEAERFLAPWNAVMFALTAELEERGVPLPAQHARKASALFPTLLPENGGDAGDADYPARVNYATARQSALMLLCAVSRRVPVLLIFEDIHWMDPYSAEMLSMLLRRMQSADISVICTCRDILPEHIRDFVEAAERDKVAVRRRLHNFTREETARYLRFYASQTLSMEQEEGVFQNTGGNALLLSQVISTMKETKRLPVLTNGLESIIAYRLSSLTGDERRVLELVSVFIGAAPFGALSAVLMKTTIEQTYLCHQLTQKKLLTETTENGLLEYGFAHERIKKAVSEKLTVTARRMLCLRVAQYLQQEQDGDQVLDQLIYYYEQGGDRFHAFRCRVLALEHDAGIYYELMPTLTSLLLAERQIENRLVEYFRSLEEQLASLRRACWGDDAKELDHMELLLLHAQGCYYIHEGDYDKGLSVLARLLELSEATNDRAMALNAHRQYVNYGIQSCDREIMRLHIERGAGLLGDESSPEKGVFLRLHGLYLLMGGQYEEARAVFRDAIRVFCALENRVDGKYSINIAGCYNYMAETYRLQGRYEEAFVHYDQSINYNRNRNYYPGAAVFYTNYGVAAWQTGQREAAERMFRYAADIYAGSREYSGYPIALSYLAYYDAEGGDDARAAERLSLALSLSRRFRSDWWTGVTIYMMWCVRMLLLKKQRRSDTLAALWPEDEREHILWALSYLRRLQPSLETDELERALRETEQA